MKATITANNPATQSLLLAFTNSSIVVTEIEGQENTVSIVLDGLIRDSASEDSLIISWPLETFRKALIASLNAPEIA